MPEHLHPSPESDLSGFVIAIDGPSGSGKSSVSKQVARTLGYGYLDTGAMYRSLTWWCLESGVDLEDGEAVLAAAQSFPLVIGTDPDDPTVRVDGTDVAQAIRETRISTNVSAVASVLPVRDVMRDLQRRLISDAGRSEGGVVAEGRDITTVVASDAPVRILLTAVGGGPARPALHGAARRRELRRRRGDPVADRRPRPRRLGGDLLHGGCRRGDDDRHLRPRLRGLRRGRAPGRRGRPGMTPRGTLIPPDAPDAPHPRRARAGRQIGIAIFHSLYRGRARHADRVPARGPVVLVANHAAFLDGPLVFSMAPRPAHFLVKQEAFRGVFGWLIRAVGQIPIDRNVGDRTALAAATAVLERGGVVGIFPEGTRRDGDVEQVNQGAAWIALRTGARIVPVAVLGTRRAGGFGGHLATPSRHPDGRLRRTVRPRYRPLRPRP